MEAPTAVVDPRLQDSQNPQTVNFRTGDIVGAYKIVSLIGKGGWGQVFKAEHSVTKRIEAIKVLSAGRAATLEEAQRFLREIQIHASLSHPNIASVHNAFWAGEDLVMAMEFVDGESLRRILERGRVPLAAALDHVCQALTALAYAHANQVTHRDITPGNMLVTASGDLKLTDFGLAKLPTDLRLTHSGMMVGSLYYMSPEQVRAIPDIDPRMDIYSMGAVMYEVVTGAKPFDGDSAFAIMLAQVGQDPPAPISLNPALPAGLSEIILKALAKDPKDRFQSAEEFRLALEPFRECENQSRTSRAGELPAKESGSIERTVVTPFNARLDSLLKWFKQTTKKRLQSTFRVPRTARSLQWGFEASTTRERLGFLDGEGPFEQHACSAPQSAKPSVPPRFASWLHRATALLGSSPIHPSASRIRHRSWFAIAASVLVLAGMVFVTGVRLPARHTPPRSIPATTELRIPLRISPETARVRMGGQDLGVVRELKLPEGSHEIEIFLEGYEPQQATILVTASGSVPLPAFVLRPLPAILKMNMSSGNAILNDEPIQLQAGLSSQDLSPGDYSLQLTQNGRSATVQFRVPAAGMPEVTEIRAGKINVTAVALFGKKAHVHRSGKSNFLEITDLTPGRQMISSGTSADATELDTFGVDVGNAPSLQVFMTDTKMVDLLVTSNEDDATVLINGVRSGVIHNGKCLLSVPPGAYTIDVKKTGFINTEKQKVLLQKGKAQTNNFALIPNSATVAVIDAPNAQIFVDGAPKGAVAPTGILDVQVEPGTRTIWLTKEGFESTRIDKTFHPGEKLSMSGNDLLKPLARVHVTITPKHSGLVAIHNGGQPQPLKEGATWLHPGDYKIVARSPGFVDELRTISLNRKDDVSLSFTLVEKLTTVKAAPPSVRTIRDLGGNWVQDDDGWWKFSGPDKYALLNLKPEGKGAFQVQRTKTGPIKFINREKSSWVAFFIDAKNHLLFELEAGQLTVTEVLHGTKKLKKRIPVEKGLSEVKIQLSARRVLLGIGNAAYVETAPDQSLIGGKFGFKGPAVIKDFSLVAP